MRAVFLALLLHFADQVGSHIFSKINASAPAIPSSIRPSRGDPPLLSGIEFACDGPVLCAFSSFFFNMAFFVFEN